MPFYVRLMSADDVSDRASDAVRNYAAEAISAGLYRPHIVFHQDRLVGFADVQFGFHATRGLTARVSAYHGAGMAAPALVEAVEQYAVQEGVNALYVSSLPGSDELNDACRQHGFDELPELSMELLSHERRPFLTVPDSVEIRHMLPEEYPRVREDVLPLVSHGSYVSTPDEISWWIRSGTYRPFIAIMDGRIVGHAETNLHGILQDGRPYARVERVAVVPEARGRGIATALVSAIVRDAFDIGCLKAELQVNPKNRAAITTYERLGFHLIDRVLFAKTLS